MINKVTNKDKGSKFEDKVSDLINLMFSLKGSKRVRRTPGSGSIVGWKGDLTNLPEELRDYVIECKDHKVLSIPAWWRQVSDEGIKMGKEPMLVFKLTNEVLMVKRFKTELKEKEDAKI